MKAVVVLFGARCAEQLQELEGNCRERDLRRIALGGEPWQERQSPRAHGYVAGILGLFCHLVHLEEVLLGESVAIEMDHAFDDSDVPNGVR